MKHILKSLLITTVLTVPAFGSGDERLGDAQETQVPMSIVKRIPKAGGLERMERLKSGPSSCLLCQDVQQSIVGSVYGDEIYVENLSLKDLSTLAQVSREWRELAQSLIDAAKQWCSTDIVLRVISGELSGYDKKMLKLFGHTSKAIKFDVLFSVLLDSRMRYTLTEIKPIINDDNLLSDDEKNILIRILSDATPYDIWFAANGLVKLGSKYSERAAQLFKKSAQHPNATSWDIEWAAEGLDGLGSEYHETASQLFKKSDQLPDVIPYNIRFAAKALVQRGPEYSERAAQLFETSAHHPNADPYYIELAAEGLAGLGSEYHERAAQLFEKLARHPDSTFGDIASAVESLAGLGSEYHERAAQLLKNQINVRM